MPEPNTHSPRSPIGSLILIGAVVAAGAAAFAYTAGWLSPNRLTPVKVVDALAPPGGPALGHRRNHAKGICFTGEFQANGSGTAISSAAVFATGTYPVIGRFNLATPMADAADGSVRVRGLGLQIAGPGGQVWRTAMITAPIFAVSTPQGFYALLQASGSKDPNAMKAFIGGHPEFLTFVHWATTAPWTDSYAEDRFNSLDSFIFTNAAGQSSAVRWSFIPAAPPVSITPADLAKRGPDYLETEIADRVAKAPQTWTLAVTVANPGDPTSDPTKAWPADRRVVTVGQLVVQKVEPEADGPCRDLNFDPTVLPAGMATSDDPFPAARSAAYAVSYDRRTSEAADYPHSTTGAKP
ncbi:catalase family peroxidase [Acidisoma silvae]|uniref:Catalase-related peroxidase n=1 Tax=Acidisoma silvae TaxID=2802396 RepID=A0A963YPC2_9PROT|nr:catalase family peroxidase [Acidisoma silvae]MCB8874242.1 catalase family peroxidase [Acidisoma silvae]